MIGSFSKTNGFLLIEFLVALAIATIFGTILILYRLNSNLISQNIKRHYYALSLARDLVQLKGVKNIKIPAYINYSVKKESDSSRTGCFVFASVVWRDARQQKHSIALETYLRKSCE